MIQAFTGKQPAEYRVTPGTGLGHINVRVGPEYAKGGGVGHHALGHVGMKIQTDDDRQGIPGKVTNAPEQFPFTIFVGFRDHCTVQIKIDPVQRPRLADAL